MARASTTSSVLPKTTTARSLASCSAWRRAISCHGTSRAGPRAAPRGAVAGRRTPAPRPGRAAARYWNQTSGSRAVAKRGRPGAGWPRPGRAGPRTSPAGRGCSRPCTAAGTAAGRRRRRSRRPRTRWPPSCDGVADPHAQRLGEGALDDDAARPHPGAADHLRPVDGARRRVPALHLGDAGHARARRIEVQVIGNGRAAGRDLGSRGDRVEPAPSSAAVTVRSGAGNTVADDVGAGGARSGLGVRRRGLAVQHQPDGQGGRRHGEGGQEQHRLGRTPAQVASGEPERSRPAGSLAGPRGEDLGGAWPRSAARATSSTSAPSRIETIRSAVAAVRWSWVTTTRV